MKFKALSKITSVFLCTSLAFPSIAQAHSGGTNSEGCHNQTSNNSYHCHSDSGSSSISDSTLYILGGAIVVGTITYFIFRGSGKNKSRSSKKKYSSNKKPSNYKRDSSYRSNRSAGIYPIDLKLSSDVSNSNPVDGELITIELLLSNEKVSTASGVKVLTNLPSNLRFSSASSENGKYDSSTGIWQVGDVNSFATLKLKIKAIYQSNQPATVKSEIYSANEIDVDSTPNNNISIEDDQTSIVVNDNRNKKIKSNISLSLDSLENFDSFISSENEKELNEQLSMNKLAMNQIIEAMKYEPEFSVKSIGLQKDNYHLEIQYNF